MAHDHVQFASPLAIMFIKPAVLMDMRAGFPVFLPEQEQSDTFVFQLLVGT